jgi:hypothetical protein
MSKLSNTGTRIWLDEYDLSGFLNAAEQSVEQKLADVGCFSDVGPRRIIGDYDHKHSHSGFLDPADNSFDERAFVDLQTDEDHYLAHLWGAYAEGGIVYESIVRLSEQIRKGSLDEAVLLNLAAEGSGGMARSTILANRTVTGNVDGTGRNMGVTAAGTIFQVVMRCFSFTGVTFDIQIQESSDDGAGDAYGAIGGLSQTITAPGIWRLTTAAATEAWKRMRVVTWNGTTAAIAVTAGTVAGT